MPGGIGLPTGWDKAHDTFIAEIEGTGDHDLEEIVLHLRDKFPEFRHILIETSTVERRLRCIDQIIGDEDISDGFKRGNRKAQLSVARSGYPMPKTSGLLVECDLKENQKLITSYDGAVTIGAALTPSLTQLPSQNTNHSHNTAPTIKGQVSSSCLSGFTSSLNTKDPGTPNTKKGKSIVPGSGNRTAMDLSWQQGIKAAGPFWHEERAPAPGFEIYEEFLSDGTWTREPIPTGKTGPTKAKMVPRI